MEVLLKRAGSCGRFQAIHVFFSQLPRFMSVWATFLMMLGSYNPGWRCVHEVANRSTTTAAAAARNDSLQILHIPPQNQALGFPPDYSLASKRWRGINHSHIQNETSRILQEDASDPSYYDYNGTCAEIDTCKTIQFNPDSKTIVTEFQLVCDRSWIVKLILVVFGLGGLPGSILAGQIGELFGRRIGLYSFTFVMGVFCGLAIFSPLWIMYAAFLFFINAGRISIVPISVVYSLEFLTPKWRAFVGGIPLWPVSLLIFTCVMTLIKNWIHLHIVTAVLSVVSCSGFFLLPESPRWLLVNSKTEKAKEVVQKIARMNRKPNPNLNILELQQLNASNRNADKKKYSYLDLFKTRHLLILSVKLAVVMIIFTVSYFCISFGIQSLSGDFYTNVIVSSCCDIVIMSLTGFLADRMGRRFVGASLSLVVSVCCVVIVVVLLIPGGGSEEVHAIIIKIPFYIAKGSANAICAVVHLFVVELFPTAVRNLALGLSRFANALGFLLAPFLIPDSSPQSLIISFSILFVCYVVDLVIFLSLPETKDDHLSDVLSERRISPDAVKEERDEPILS